MFVSVTWQVVTAYLMRAEHLTLHAALSSLRDVHPASHPNLGFMHQLQLYEQMGWDIMNPETVSRVSISKPDYNQQMSYLIYCLFFLPYRCIIDAKNDAYKRFNLQQFGRYHKLQGYVDDEQLDDIADYANTSEVSINFFTWNPAHDFVRTVGILNAHSLHVMNIIYPLATVLFCGRTFCILNLLSLALFTQVWLVSRPQDTSHILVIHFPVWFPYLAPYLVPFGSFALLTGASYWYCFKYLSASLAVCRSHRV